MNDEPPDRRTDGYPGADDRVAALVRTVLYEGYALYPYRPSALKNQKRFAFGAVYPKAWASRIGEPFTMRAECVVDGGTRVEITVGFLVLRRGGGGTEHAVVLDPRPLGACEWREAATIRLAIELASETDILHHRAIAAGIRLGLTGTIVDVGDGLWRIAVEVDNVTAIDAGADREAAMDVTLASTHVLVRAIGGTAVSTIDPPERAANAVAACRTLGCYPVIVARDTVLASPIVLPDFPELAEQSPGDWFDGTEIDEMLTLRVLTLTDAEKREAAAADPRIAELLRRTEERGIEATAQLHGVTRMGPRIGTRVRLRPTGRADAFDIILAGKLATVAGVERDLDGRAHFAVTIDDDPGADLGAQGMPGHRFYFRSDELEVVA